MQTSKLARKYLISFLIVIGMSLSFTVAADTVVANAQIDKIGLFFPDTTRGAMIQLTDLSSNPAWEGSRQFFMSQTTLGREGFDLALDAIDNGYTLWVSIAGSASPLSLINIMYMNIP